MAGLGTRARHGSRGSLETPGLSWPARHHNGSLGGLCSAESATVVLRERRGPEPRLPVFSIVRDRPGPHRLEQQDQESHVETDGGPL